MKIIEKICVVLAPIGLLFAIGSVGAIEHNVVSEFQGIIQAVSGMVVSAVSGIVYEHVTK